MVLLKNNVIALMIHFLGLFLSMIFLFVYVYASPLYKSQIVSLIVMVFLYLFLVILYEALLIRYLQLSKRRRDDYLSGILTIVIGLAIWGYVYFSQTNMLEKALENEQWIPYNFFIFFLWPVAYFLKNHLILLILGLLNGLFAPIALFIKRSKSDKAERQRLKGEYNI